MVAVVTIVLTGCIGAVDRSEFDAEVRARGGGVTTDWIAESFDLVAAEAGATSADQLSVLSVRVDPPIRSTTISARRADRPDFVDVVSVRDGEVVSVSPIQDADNLPLDDITFSLSSVPVEMFEALTDQAIVEFAETDGFVDAITISYDGFAPVIKLEMESARRTANAVFTLDGVFVEIER